MLFYERYIHFVISGGQTRSITVPVICLLDVRNFEVARYFTKVLLRCGRIFNKDLITDLPTCPTVKEFEQVPKVIIVKATSPFCH